MPSDRLLVINPGAGSLRAGGPGGLRDLFPGWPVLELEPGRPLAAAAKPPPGGRVVVAGGDGTVASAARWLAGSGCALGLVPTGTFNNFARSLGLPEDPEAAARLARDGRARPVAIGRVNGRPFLEAAAAGFLGDALALGEAAKELRFGELAERLRAVTGAPRFAYRVTGDLSVRGRAYSLVAANTASIGAHLELARTSPRTPELELVVQGGRGRLEALRRLLRRRPAATAGFRSVRLETDPPVRVYADSDEAGETPAEFRVDDDSLEVVLPG